MKRVALVALVAIVIAFAVSRVSTQQEDAFVRTGERGEKVHVLPPPEMIRGSEDRLSLFARTSHTASASSFGYTVYRASYGSGNLQYHGGPEITNAGFQPIYWNSAIAGSTSANSSLGYKTVQSQIAAFIKAFPDNKNWDASATDDYEVIQQYSTGNTAILATLAQFPDFVDGKSFQSSITDTAIQNYLTTLFQLNSVTPSADTIYGVYFPPNMTVYMGSYASCSSFCGYHGVYTYTNSSNQSMQIKYAVFPYPGCSGCSLSGLSAADMLTIVSSHEIREAVTDPGDNGVNAWYDSAGYEADDKCAWHNLYQMQNGKFWVQPEYSNGITYGGSTFPRYSFTRGGCVVPK